MTHPSPVRAFRGGRSGLAESEYGQDGASSHVLLPAVPPSTTATWFGGHIAPGFEPQLLTVMVINSHVLF